MRRPELVKEIELPEGVTVSFADKILSVKGPKGELSRQLYSPAISFTVDNGVLSVSSKNVGKKEKMLFGTFTAHAKNMVKGVTEGFTYKLKICSGHFPMSVKVQGNTVSLSNYLGEKVPRLLSIKDGVSVKVEGDIITVEAIDKELAGTVASDIEILARLPDKDRRIYQDGIFITNKAGKEV
ncbi:MAG: 50S ribosomal protein L6 [Candidatus Woesearchaeota archaeon]